MIKHSPHVYDFKHGYDDKQLMGSTVVKVSLHIHEVVGLNLERSGKFYLEKIPDSVTIGHSKTI